MLKRQQSFNLHEYNDTDNEETKLIEINDDFSQQAYEKHKVLIESDEPVCLMFIIFQIIIIMKLLWFKLVIILKKLYHMQR